MKPVHSFVVTAKLPKKIEQLKELANNYWWCWDSDAKELFNRIDRHLWDEVHHNPVLMINKLSQEKLLELAGQSEFISFMHYVHDKFIHYMKSTTWFDKQNLEDFGNIAYFSPEFGINESFPIYSGGLGVLSGDHLKSSSDLGLPLVGVGLLYQQGYFRQHLTQSGWQNEIYNYNDFFSMPITLIRDEKDDPVIIDVDLPLGKAFAQIWRLQVGRVPLFLLDTNIDLNGIEEYRDITDQLYGGTRETRIQQEILLGIGGMRALHAMGIVPHVVHINEGHAAFALLERCRYFMEEYKIDFEAAKQIVRSSSAFTTHTPVPAGNETFRLDRIEHYLNRYWPLLKIQKEEFIELGQEAKFNHQEKFSMTVLGLRLSSYRNGVSKLHGNVSRNMWHRIWKGFPIEEIPIRSITNGVHTLTWLAREFSSLCDRYLSPGWRSDPDTEEIWQKVDQIPSEEIYREKQRRRVRLILYARDYLKKKQKAFLPADQITKINEYLDSHALTIGFARRFATYKRATLLFSDMERLSKILTNPDMPVQILIAGKAHPHDTAGKEVIQTIIHRIRDYGLERHVLFLEDYDMVIARLMVKGCDIWLNTPIKPQEASGTSGMKAAINGTLNCSILDGWWAEAYNGKNGFAIGEGEEYKDGAERDIIESEIIYDLFEKTIVPMFYDRDRTGTPRKWVEYMKESIKTIAPKFSTSRMVKQYAEMFYLPAIGRFDLLSSNNGKKADELKAWKMKVRNDWDSIEVIDAGIKENGEAFVGKPIKVYAVVNLGQLTPEDVQVQVYYGSVNPNGELLDTNHNQLHLANSEDRYHHYEGEYICPETGQQGFTIRILPTNPLLRDSSELYLCTWA